MALMPGMRDDAEALVAGMTRFFDRKLGTIRRFLPNVTAKSKAEGDLKDPDEVDSWYLYHPLTNLGTLAIEGHRTARKLFLGSLDFAIRVARHFDYQWPVLFDVTSLAIRTGDRKPGDPGQSDVGGLYAEVMLKAFDLTGEQRFVDEAKAAIRATKGLKFALTYQANLTARGLMPCLRLWQMTGDRFFRDQSKVFLASFFHNTIFWESDIERAASYPTFLGATCLHDGPYMAIFECFESFEGFRDYLRLGSDDLPASVRTLVEAYCQHALHRAWYFYPAHVPKRSLSDNARSGELDATLPIPLEDLYADGQPMGQVGQEVYGSGAAFAFAAYPRFDNANELQR